MLSKHSLVLREMLELRVQENRKPAVLHGYPCIALDDAREDVQTLLRIVYNDP